MATAPGKPSIEADKSSAFSYAQAAKGLSGTEKVVSTTPTTKDSSGSQLSMKRSDSIADMPPVIKPDKSDTEHSGNAQKKQGHSEDSNSRLARKSVAEPNINPDQRPNNCLDSFSPDYGVSSTSTLVKDDDSVSMQNAGSSDSTWENKSQNSIPVEKHSESHEADSTTTQTKEPTNDVPQKTLQEAPAPSVNVWKQRADEARAKRELPKFAGKGSIDSIKEFTPQMGYGSNESDRNGFRKKPGSYPSIFVDNQSFSEGMKDRKLSVDLSKNNGHRSSQYSKSNVDKLPEERQSNINGSRLNASPSRLVNNYDADRFPSTSPNQDQELWPTPDSARDDEKKKAREKIDKGEKERVGSNSSRPHGRYEWVSVPYTPNVIFSTPFPKITPRRGRGGGRAGRDTGGRTGLHGFYNNAMTEQDAGASAEPAGIEKSRRIRHEASAGISDRNSPSRRRSIAAGDTSAKPETLHDSDNGSFPSTNSTERTEQHRATTSPQRNSLSFQHPHARHIFPGRGKPGRKYEANGTFDRRRASEAGYSRYDSNANPNKNNVDYSVNTENYHPGRFGLHVDTYSHSRDRRGDHRSYDTYHFRERGETRGRAGVRTRNFSQGLNGTSQNYGHTFQGGLSGITSNAINGPRSPGYSLYQSNGDGHGTSNNQARYRGMSRSHNQSSENYSRHNSEPAAQSYAIASHPVFTPGSYDFSAPQPLSTPPYNAFVDMYSLLSMVTGQLEYYFSVDNLCKDMFLPNFNRIRQLTTDMDVIKTVCYQSHKIEYKVGNDGRDRLRRHDGWETWVLPVSDRDAAAQNDGPAELKTPPMPYPQSFEIPLHLQQPIPATSIAPLGQPSFVEPSYLPANGLTQPMGEKQLASETESNDARDAVGPLVVSSSGAQDLPPLTYTNTQLRVEEDAFPDSQIESLSVIVRQQERGNQTGSARMPASRSFSNGSLDEKDTTKAIPETHAEDENNNVNGEAVQSLSERIFSAKHALQKNSTKSEENALKPPVRLNWVKDHETPVEKLPKDALYELYTDVRARALKQRQDSAAGTCPFEIEILYQFWSHFLIRNFNTSMYDEFRNLAFEDVTKKASIVGLQNLIKFYSESLHSQTIIRERVARHFVELVKVESLETERFAFKKLRSAWRNGALDLRNRKRISAYIDPDLREALER